MNEIQDLDEYTLFIPIGNITLPTSASVTIIVVVISLFTYSIALYANNNIK